MAAGGSCVLHRRARKAWLSAAMRMGERQVLRKNWSMASTAERGSCMGGNSKCRAKSGGYLGSMATEQQTSGGCNSSISHQSSCGCTQARRAMTGHSRGQGACSKHVSI